METGWQGAFRSRGFFGPYEEKVVLEQKDTDVNGPHQGGWVRTGTREDWFLHFQQRGAYGRVVHLQPMRWGTDGWPVLGDDGAPVTEHTRPALPPQPPAAPATDDDFPGGAVRPPVVVDGQPRDGWATQHSGDGLRLACVRSADAHDLRKLPNVLTQRLPGDPAVIEVELRLDSEETGRAGRTRGARRRLPLDRAPAGRGRDRAPGAPVRRVGGGGRPGRRPPLAPRPRAGHGCGSRPAPADAAASPTTSATGRAPPAEVFAATPWRWVGALLGLFARSRPPARGDARSGHLHEVPDRSPLTHPTRTPCWEPQ